MIYFNSDASSCFLFRPCWTHGTCKLYFRQWAWFFVLIFLHAEPNELWLIEGLWDLASEHRVDCADYHQEDRVAGGKQVIVQCAMWYCDKLEVPTQTRVTLEMWRSCLAICWAMCHFTSNAPWLKSNSEQVLSVYASSSIFDFSKYFVLVWLWKKINID